MLYRCVNCGGNVVYDPAKKKMVCLSCGGSDCQELVPSQEPVICINCGSQIPYTEYQSAGRCPSCGTYLLRDDKVNYPYGADVILPFKISKHEAEEKLRNEFGKKLFIPGTFLSQKTLEALKGVYVPFWMYDYDSAPRTKTPCPPSRPGPTIICRNRSPPNSWSTSSARWRCWWTSSGKTRACGPGPVTGSTG